MLAFSGSRYLSVSNRNAVQGAVKRAHEYNLPIAVGCAKGLDALVRESPNFSGRVFTAKSQLPGHLVQRSVAMVRHVAGYEHASLLIWPGRACPDGLMPSSIPSKCFAGYGSGTWATAAHAVGVRCKLYVFQDDSADQLEFLSWLPQWGSWQSTARWGSQSMCLVPAERFCRIQLSLFGV